MPFACRFIMSIAAGDGRVTIRFGLPERHRLMPRFRCRVAFLLAFLLAACAAPSPPLPAPDRDRVVDERVRAPAEGSDDELQVFRVRNPAVEALGRQAEVAERGGDLDRAEMLLERALRIDARDPFILQQLAELHLTRGRLDQAESFATRSWELGPRVGEVCRRSLRTLMIVAERQGRWDDAFQTEARLPRCRVAPPERF